MFDNEVRPDVCPSDIKKHYNFVEREPLYNEKPAKPRPYSKTPLKKPKPPEPKIFTGYFPKFM